MHIAAGKIKRIANGSFRSIVVHQDQVYAADSEKCQTQVFQYKEASSPAEWLQLRSIDHDFNAKGSTLTLSISNNQLKCCSDVDDSIKVYSLSGELLQTHGTSGRGDAGLYSPYISDDDDDGSVLIADRLNNRLQVMSEQGEFSVLQSQPRVSGPSSAVLFNNQLYVMSDSYINSKVCKYSC